MLKKKPATVKDVKALSFLLAFYGLLVLQFNRKSDN